MATGDPLILGTSNDQNANTTLNAVLPANRGLIVSAPEFAVAVEANGFIGMVGRSTNIGSYGVYGTSPNGLGVWGDQRDGGTGVEGDSYEGLGVVGTSSGLTGAALAAGVLGSSDNSFGVRGQSGDANLLPPVGGGPPFFRCGVQGSSDEGTGVRGDSAHHVGVRGRTYSGDGVYGSTDNQPGGPKASGNAIHGSVTGAASNTQTGPFAGVFEGNVSITSLLFGEGGVIISNALISVAAGVAKLDQKGESVVELPKGTSGRHANFHYQLTAMGVPAPDLHVAAPVRGDQFKIRGGAPNAKVSWHISGEPKSPKAGRRQVLYRKKRLTEK